MIEPYFVALYPPSGAGLDLIAGIKAWLSAGGTFYSNLAGTLMEPYFVALYPPSGAGLDLIAGIKAWLSAGGTFYSNLVGTLTAWDPTSSVQAPFFTELHYEGIHSEHTFFDTAKPDSLASFFAAKCARVHLTGPFYGPMIAVEYFLYAPVDPLIQFVYHYPHMWGQGRGGLTAANNALFALADAAGAAYVLTSVTDGHNQMHKQFVQYEEKYWFVLPPELKETGHQMLSLDSNPKFCSDLPFDIPTLVVESMPYGYTRHWLKGHSPPGLSDDWPRLKRPGPRPL